ncbi:DUF1513 domain-containing protein [Marinospirillum insulare]|uniref:DUF1513 domain-containing protein n=1 Tax=Marinospirillum insulare TaxID=217169 RepID=A0ABQ5ZXF7_9GAMM|nr:DUF1513 domain-containing protein [Marinospirillum insulare]GLR64127.1 hypothetical protein GCM10007878_15650 [Marinospirillum insulare]
MRMNRRQLLSWLAAAPLLAKTQFSLANDKQRITQQLMKQQAEQLYASAAKKTGGGYYLSFFNGLGQEQTSHPLPSRAHHILADSKRGWLFTIARRPGEFIDIYDYRNNRPLAHLKVQPNHYLQGHALLSPDGRYLYTSETSLKDDQGHLVVRDLENKFKPVNKLATGGIEPHEFLWMPDGKTLVVANGGIATEGRKKLNLETMQSSLVYLNSQTDEIIEKQQLADEYHQCSLRHLDVANNGQVVVALQYQGHPADQVPLVLAHKQGEALETLAMPELIRSQLQQYCGSACFDSSGQFAAVSSPRGNQVMLWDMQQRSFLSSIYAADGCGLAATQKEGEFLVSTGRGKVYQLSALTGNKQLLQLQDGNLWHWDNHLTAVT